MASHLTRTGQGWLKKTWLTEVKRTKDSLVQMGEDKSGRMGRDAGEMGARKGSAGTQTPNDMFQSEQQMDLR